MRKKEMLIGWLSPDGELFKCKYCEHNATAEEICEKFNIEYNNFSYYGKDDVLLTLGWCKLGISSFGDKQYWVYWQRPLTPYQRYFLNEYFDNEKELLFPIDVTSCCKYYHEDKFLK